MAGMTLSTKVGIVSILLLTGSLFPSPYSGAFAITSGVWGIAAAILGSKWWLAVPGAILGMTAVMFFVLRHSH